MNDDLELAFGIPLLDAVLGVTGHPEPAVHGFGHGPNAGFHPLRQEGSRARGEGMDVLSLPGKHVNELVTSDLRSVPRPLADQQPAGLPRDEKVRRKR